MTPSVPSSRYHSTSRDPRLFTDSQGIVPSSNGSVYSHESQFLQQTFTSSGELRTQFIPTPSEMTTYGNYATGPPRSPTAPPSARYSSTGSLNYSAHLVASTHGGPTRPRISTTRPRSGTLGSSPGNSPSGERFPCEKCGKTFSRSHDRKRHHETQHLATPIIHRCRWCEKEFSR